ncbi:hypothetical protein pb186bvf_020809 [Paramecium bursaria]
MLQIQSEPKNAGTKIQKIQQIAFDVLNKRAKQLNGTMDKCNGEVDLKEMVDFYERIIVGMKYQNPKISNFRLQILISGTRSWEAFSLDAFGKKRFKFNKITHVEKIKNEYYFNQVIIGENVQILRIQNSHILLKKVKENLFANFGLLQDIFGNISQERIAQFFEETKFYTFRYTNFTQELVSSKQYHRFNFYQCQQFVWFKFFQWQLFDDAEDQFQNLETLPRMINQEPVKFVHLKAIDKLLETLEHECCHNIPRWDSLNGNPLLISPEKNQKLRVDKIFQEAGHYYAQMAYKITSEVSPFCVCQIQR